MADDPFSFAEKALKGPAAAAPSASTDPFSYAVGAIKATPAKKAAPPKGASVADSLPDWMRSAGHMIGTAADGYMRYSKAGVQGLHDVVQAMDVPAQYLENKFGPITLNGLLPTAKAAHAANVAQTQAYEAQPHDAVEQLGRISGNIVGTLPVMAAAGPYLAAAGGIGTSAMEAVPLLARAVPAVEAAGRFIAGNAGQGEGIVNSLLRLASRGTVGAEAGAAGNAMIGQDPATGAGVGAVLGAGGSAAFDLARVGARAVGDAVRPFTEGGRSNIVGDFIRRQAAGGPTAVDMTNHIPGSPPPTLAEATGNPGIAGVQRTVSTQPTQVPKFGEVRTAQNEARNAFLDDLKGTPDTIADLVAAREGAAIPKLHAALANAKSADPLPVINEIHGIVNSPAGQRDIVKSSLEKILPKLKDEKGVLQSDPAQLYGIRQSISDMISPLSAGTASDARLASTELLQVQSKLDDAIEKAAPGYKDYMATYAEKSRPIDAAKYLQGLNLTDSQGNVTLAKIDNAIKSIEKQRAKGGVNDAKSIADHQLAALDALRADLRRQGNISLGKAIGSDTAQNLGTEGALNLGGIPTLAGGLLAGHPAIGAIASLLNSAGRGRANEKILDLLGTALADANIGAKYLAKPGRLRGNVPHNALLAPVGAVIGNAVNNRLLGPN